MAGPLHFDAHADDYAHARPPYPAKLWNAIARLGLLRPGLRAVDLGAGTGQATGPLIAAGLQVTAVEPGPNLARHLATSHPTARVLTARAEDIDLPENSFDLAVAATSIHWMDLDVVLPTLHRLLASGATFLVWRTVFGDPAAPSTPFREKVAEIVQARTQAPRPGPASTHASAVAASLTRTGLFTADDIHTFSWTVKLDHPAVRRLFGTFSDWSAPEVNQAAEAAIELGGQVTEHYLSWLIVARPT